MTAQTEFRVGQGWDIHALVEGRPLILGGVAIPHTHGLLGHSDADALLHAVTDALLGAAGLGTLAVTFPIPTRSIRVQIRLCCWRVLGKMFSKKVGVLLIWMSRLSPKPPD